MTQQDKEHLRWIYNRMVEIHKENPNVDYMNRFDAIIDDKPKPSDNEIYFHKDLLELFFEETMPEKNFKFIGTDGLPYTFDVRTFNYLLSEERRDTVIDVISTINGSIKWMVELGIAKPLF
jgi:hypothetical protein